MVDTPETENGNTEYLRDWALNSLDADLSVSDEVLRGNAALLAAAEADYNAIHGVNAWARNVAETRQDLQEDADSFWDWSGNGDEALANFDPAQLLVEWIREDYPREQERIEAEAATLTEFPQDLQDLMATGSSEELMAAAMHYSVYASRGAIALQNLEDGQMTAEGVAQINADVEMYQNFSDRLWRQGVTRMDASDTIKNTLLQNHSAHLVMGAEQLAEEDGTLSADQVRDLGVMSAIYSRLEGAAASGYAENLTDRIAQQLMPPEGQRTESQEALLAQVREMETFISTMPDDPEELISAAQDYESRAETATFYNDTASGFGYDGSIFTQASRPTEAELAQTESFQQAARILFEKETGQTWEEAGGENGYDAETIGDWGISYMSEQQNQFWEVLQQAGDIRVFSDYSPEEMNEMMAFLYASQTFEITRNDWGTFGRAAGNMLTDETNILSVALAVGSGGTSLLAQQGIKRAGQQAAMGVIREAVENGVQVGVREAAEVAAREAAERSVLTGVATTTRRFAAIEGSFGAVDGALQFNNDYLRQTGTDQTEFNWGTYTFGVGTGAAAGFAADYAIGRGLGFAIEGAANGVTRALNFGPTRARAAELDAAALDATVTPEAAATAPIETAPRVETTQAPAQPIIADAAEAVEPAETLTPISPVEITARADTPETTLTAPDADISPAALADAPAPRVEAEATVAPSQPNSAQAADDVNPAETLTPISPVEPAARADAPEAEIVTPDLDTAPIAQQAPEPIRSSAAIQAEQLAAQRARQGALLNEELPMAAQEGPSQPQPTQQQQANAGDAARNTTPPAQPAAPRYRGNQAHTYTPDQADIFTPQRLARINDENFGRIQPDTLKAFTPAQRAALTDTQQDIFTNRVAPSLQPQDVANLDTAFIRTLRPDHIENLDADVMIEIAQNAQLSGAFRTDTAQAFVPRLESIQAVRRTTQGPAPVPPARDAAPEADTTTTAPRADGETEPQPQPTPRTEGERAQADADAAAATDAGAAVNTERSISLMDAISNSQNIFRDRWRQQVVEPEIKRQLGNPNSQLSKARSAILNENRDELSPEKQKVFDKAEARYNEAVDGIAESLERKYDYNKLVSAYRTIAEARRVPSMDDVSEKVTNKWRTSISNALQAAVDNGWHPDEVTRLIVHARAARLGGFVKKDTTVMNDGNSLINIAHRLPEGSYGRDLYDKVIRPLLDPQGSDNADADVFLLRVDVGSKPYGPDLEADYTSAWRPLINLKDHLKALIPLTFNSETSIGKVARSGDPMTRVMQDNFFRGARGMSVKDDGTTGFSFGKLFTNYTLNAPSFGLWNYANNVFTGTYRYGLKAAALGLALGTTFVGEELIVEPIIGQDLTIAGHQVDVTRRLLQDPAYIADVTFGNLYAGLVDENTDMSFNGPGYVTADWAYAFGDADPAEPGVTAPGGDRPYSPPYRSDAGGNGDETVHVAQADTDPATDAAADATSAPDASGETDSEDTLIVANNGDTTPPPSGDQTPPGTGTGTDGAETTPPLTNAGATDTDFTDYLPVTLQRLFTRENQQQFGQAANQAGGFFGGLATGAAGIFRNLNTMLGPTWGPVAGVVGSIFAGFIGFNFVKNIGNFLTGGGLMKLGGAAVLGTIGLYAFEHFSGARERFEQEQGQDARLRNTGPLTTAEPDRSVGRTTLQRDHDFTYQGAIDEMDRRHEEEMSSLGDTFVGQGNGNSIPRDVALLAGEAPQQSAALDGMTITGDFRGISHDGGASNTFMLTADATGTAGIMNASDMALVGGAQSAEYGYTVAGAQTGLGFDGAQIAGGTYAATGNTHLPANFAALINDPAATRYDRTGHDRDQAIATPGWDSDIYTPAAIDRQVAQGPMSFNELTA